jgi:hypothetical protein
VSGTWSQYDPDALATFLAGSLDIRVRNAAGDALMSFAVPNMCVLALLEVSPVMGPGFEDDDHGVKKRLPILRWTGFHTKTAKGRSSRRQMADTCHYEYGSVVAASLAFEDLSEYPRAGDVAQGGPAYLEILGTFEILGFEMKGCVRIDLI